MDLKLVQFWERENLVKYGSEDTEKLDLFQQLKNYKKNEFDS